jgi:hypothetical protein
VDDGLGVCWSEGGGVGNILVVAVDESEAYTRGPILVGEKLNYSCTDR